MLFKHIELVVKNLVAPWSDFVLEQSIQIAPDNESPLGAQLFDMRKSANFRVVQEEENPVVEPVDVIEVPLRTTSNARAGARNRETAALGEGRCFQAKPEAAQVVRAPLLFRVG